MEIPGYYYDPRVRRYFREDPAHPRPVGASESTDAPTAPTPIIDILKKRELGRLCGSSFQKSVVTSRAQSLRCVNKIEKADCSDRVVTFVKSEKNCIYVETRFKNEYFLGRQTNVLCKGYDWHHTYNPTIDMCDLFCSEDSNVCQMSCSVKSSQRSSWLVCFYKGGTLRLEVFAIHEYEHPIWCCAAMNKHRPIFVTGHSNCIRFFMQNAAHYQGIKTNNEVRAVQCAPDGNAIFAGFHTGRLSILDLNTRNWIHHDKLHHTGINEIIYLKEENSIICGAFDGWICKYDLRQRKQVLEYNGHQHAPRRRPFSVDETSGLLSATGTDGLTRLWALSHGGPPIRTLLPPDPKRSYGTCMHGQGLAWNLYLFQGGDTHIFGTEDLNLIEGV